jgi:hypothetical protein
MPKAAFDVLGARTAGQHLDRLQPANQPGAEKHASDAQIIAIADP